jgi:hypothetical protein
MKKIIPINYNIHIEPDGYFIGLDEKNRLTGFENAIRNVERIRQKFHEVGKTFNVQWLVRADKQIEKVYGSVDWIFKEYEKEINVLKDKGDEIGIHMHLYQWDEGLGNWKLNFDDKDYTESLVEQSVNAYRTHFNEAPSIYSMGDTWTDTHLINYLASFGIKYELTTVPRRGIKPFSSFNGQYSGKPANYINMPSHPYFPDSSDFTVESKKRDGLAIVPLTTGNWKSFFYTKQILIRMLKARRFKSELIKIDKFQVLSGIENDRKTFISMIKDPTTSHFSFECRSAMFNSEKGISRFNELADFFSEEISDHEFLFTTSQNLMEIYHSSLKV